MKIEQAIREYLPTIIHMSLATALDGRPWVCELHYAYDDDLNLYFRSLPSRRHSIEIAQNPYVSGSIVTQHEITEKPRGIYFEGLASVITAVDENHIAYKRYCERFSTGPDILEDAKSDNGHKFYKVTVEKYYVFDAIETSPGKKYELDMRS